MQYFIIMCILALIFYSIYVRNNTYLSFTLGVQDALSLVYTIFPYIFAVFVILELIKTSGLSSIISSVIGPMLTLLSVPQELGELVLIKMLSGSGSIAVLEGIYETHGVDSFISTVASVIVGSSEAVFYVMPVLFSNSKITHFRYGM